jgi:hypothetical protein
MWFVLLLQPEAYGINHNPGDRPVMTGVFMAFLRFSLSTQLTKNKSTWFEARPIHSSNSLLLIREKVIGC